MKIFLLLFLCLILYKECAASNSTGNQDKNNLFGPFGISFNMEELDVFEDGFSKVTKRGNVTFSKPSAWLFGSNEVKVDMMYEDYGEKNKNESWELYLTDVENSQSIGGLKLTRDLDISPWFRIEKSDEILLNILGADVRIQVTQNPQTPNQLSLMSNINYGDQVFKINSSYSVDRNVSVLAIDVDGHTWTAKAVVKRDNDTYDNDLIIDLDLHLKDKYLRLELNVPPIGSFFYIDQFVRIKYKLIVDHVMILTGGRSFEGLWVKYMNGWDMCYIEFERDGPFSNNLLRLKHGCNGRQRWLLSIDSFQEAGRLNYANLALDVRLSYKGAEQAKGLIKWNLENWREFSHLELNLVENGPNGTHGFTGGLNATLELAEMKGDLNITFDGGQRINEKMDLLAGFQGGSWQLNFQDLKRQIDLTLLVTYFGFPRMTQDWENMSLWLQKQFFFRLDMPTVRRWYIWPYRVDKMNIVGDTTGSLVAEFRNLSYRIIPLTKRKEYLELQLSEHKRNNDTDTFRIVYDGQTITGNGTISDGYSSYPLSFHHDSVGDVKRGSLLLTRSRGSYLFQLESVYVNSKQLEIFYVQDQECEKGKILLGFDELGEFVLEHRSPICPWGPPDREEQSWRFSLSTNYKAEPDGYDNLLNSKLKLNDKLDTSLKLHALGHLEGTQLHDSFSSDFYNAPESVLRPLLSMLKDFVLDLLSSYIDYKDSTNYNYNDYDPYYDRS